MQPLSKASRDLLAELTSYHEDRLRALETQRSSKGPRLNLARAILDLAQDRIHGEDREILQEYARHAGIQHPDPYRPFIPFSALRDLSKGVAGAGGYLVSAETQESVDILRPWSVTARAGIEIETGLRGDQVVPKATAKSTPAWLSTELTQITASQPPIAQIAMTPKQVGDQITFSRQLAKQANADAFVRRELLRTIGTAIDQAVLNGSGAAGQPLGVLLTAGVQTQSGTTLGHAGVSTMKRKIADTNAPDDAIAFLGTTAVRELLETRERFTGGGLTVWEGDRVAGRPAFASTDVPASTLIAGAWPVIYLGIWGDGFIVEINPYDPAGFKVGTIQARLIVSCDIAIRYAAAFCKAESIT